jgi:hypothetical protein
MLFAGTAAAHHKASHTQDGGDSGGSHKEPDGDADSDSGTFYTEDNDTNDGDTPNNVPDAGDNKHPSGKDKSVEHGPGNQGKSESDPDDNGKGPDRSNGGPDKPNGSGGDDLADQDGNNGCGNDDDFEDDNEGKCKGHKREDPPGPPDDPPDGPPNGPPKEPPRSEPPGPPGETGTLPDVLGTDEARPEPPAVAALRTATVASGAPLPFTGRSIGPVLIAALVIIAGGLLVMRVRRPQRAERE